MLSANSTLPVLAIEAGDEEGSLRVVAPGEACGFAVDSYKGTLYVELRKRSDDPTDADLRLVHPRLTANRAWT